jgi:hypothetical protein
VDAANTAPNPERSLARFGHGTEVMLMISRLLVRLVLIARSILCLAFAWYLGAVAPPSPPSVARVFALFAMADGVLALVLGPLALSARVPAAIAVVAIVGGLIRVAAALAIWLGPGIPFFALTLVLYVGVLATLGFLLGVVELVEAARLERRVGRNPVSLILVLEGLATAILGVVAFFAEPEPSTVRRLLIVGAALEAFGLLAVALRVGELQARADAAT